MKFNFPIDSFELHLEDTLLLLAEGLLAENALKSFAEVEKNLFLARFTEGSPSTVPLSSAASCCAEISIFFKFERKSKRNFE